MVSLCYINKIKEAFNERGMSQTDLPIRLGTLIWSPLCCQQASVFITNALWNSRDIGYGHKRPVSTTQEIKYTMKLIDITKGSEHDLSLSRKKRLPNWSLASLSKRGKKVLFPLWLVPVVNRKSNSLPRRLCVNCIYWCWLKISAIRFLA